MNYLIAIVDDKHPDTALAFAKAVVNGGHTIARLFFFKNGVSIGESTHPAHSMWQDFSIQHGVELILCSAAAQRRNIQPTAESAFTIGGLGLYAEAQTNGDKVIHFD